MVKIISRNFPVPHGKYKPLYAGIKNFTFSGLKHKRRLTKKSAMLSEQNTDSLIYRYHGEKIQY